MVLKSPSHNFPSSGNSLSEIVGLMPEKTSSISTYISLRKQKRCHNEVKRLNYCFVRKNMDERNLRIVKIFNLCMKYQTTSKKNYMLGFK